MPYQTLIAWCDAGYLKPGALYAKVVHTKGEHKDDGGRASFKSGQPQRTGKVCCSAQVSFGEYDGCTPFLSC